MRTDLGYHKEGDLGGPVDIDEGYRWNVPLVTYGFDQEFTDYFGDRGISAAEEAVAIINALPPASEIVLDDFPFESWRPNDTARALGLVDLKSSALSAILEQLGLADALRFTWTIRERAVDGTRTNYSVVQRNFDPETYDASPTINNETVGYTIFWGIPNLGSRYDDAVEFAPFPISVPVAGHVPQAGLFSTALSRDDAGGLRFLLSRNNRKVERLLPGITAAAANTNRVVDVALRPGIEKIQLVRMMTDGGQFVPITNVFIDTFFTNGIAQTQQLQRVICEPDILFRAKDLGVNFYFSTNFPSGFVTRIWEKGGASGWQNNAEVNNKPGAAGPGIIQPGGAISFNKIGRYWSSQIGTPEGRSYRNWASYGEGPDDMFVYLGHEVATSATVSTRLLTDGPEPLFEWKVLLQTDVNYRLDSSTNLIDWTSVRNLSNTNDGFTTLREPVSGPMKSFRLVLEPQ